MDGVTTFLIIGTVIGVISCFVPDKKECNKEKGVCFCRSDEDRINCEVEK